MNVRNSFEFLIVWCFFIVCDDIFFLMARSEEEEEESYVEINFSGVRNAMTDGLSISGGCHQLHGCNFSKKHFHFFD